MLKTPPDSRLKLMGKKLRTRLQFDIPTYNDKYDVMTAIFERNQLKEFAICSNIYKSIKYV